MELGLKERVAVITGPAKGMGAAVTRAFAEEGCRLVLAGRDTAAIEPVAQDMRERGAQVVVCLLYTSPSPRDRQKSRMPSSA